MSDMCNARFLTVYIFTEKKKKLPSVFGTRTRELDGPQMWKQHNKPKRQDFSPDVTDHWGRNDHLCEDSCITTRDWNDYWGKVKYNCWEETDYNGHQFSADVRKEYRFTHSSGNERQNIKHTSFIRWSCKLCACIFTVALFFFLVAITVF